MARLWLLLLATALLGAAQTAQYVTPLDTMTQGAWTNKYGASGYLIANDSNSQSAPYVNVSVSDASTYTWGSQSTDPRALQIYAGSSIGIASQYFGNSFKINVTVTDGNTYPVALYLLDWDNQSPGARAESITVVRADNGTPLDTENFSGFNSGVWAVWNISGSVVIQVNNTTTSDNATVSGIFVGAAISGSPASQTITFNSIAAQTVGATLPLTATASSGLAVSFASSTTSVCTVSGSTATFLAAGNCTITASQAGNSSYAAASPVSQTFAVNGGGSTSGNASTFATDTMTLGSKWPSMYGASGYQIANDSNSQAAANVNVSVSGASTYTWGAQASISAYPQALLASPTATTGIASQYFSSSSFSINVSVTDGNTYPVALYLLDWDKSSRVETIQITANGSSVPLQTQTFRGFGSGLWVVSNISGSVSIQITNAAGSVNATVSGIFVGAAISGSPASQTITFNSIAAQTVGATLPLTATASSGLAVSFASSTTSVCTVSGSTATFLAAGNCTITASQAGNSSYAAATPVSQTFAVTNGNAPTASAVFLPPDATTQGSWFSAYGTTYGFDGYQIANGGTSLPSYATVTFAGQSTYSVSSTDARCLFSSLTSTSRSPSAYVSPSQYVATSAFTISVNVNDTTPHMMSLYLLDLDSGQRKENITISDASGNQLDQESFANFHNGVWASWKIQGSVTITVSSTNTPYLNAAVSGIFFDPAPGPISPMQQINAGGAAIQSTNWQADKGSSGGTINSVSAATSISTAKVVNPAPLDVYRSQRVGNSASPGFNYTMTGLAHNAPYTVYLHFAELIWQTAGQRKFDVVINNLLVLHNFDIIGALGAGGGPDQALVEAFATKSDYSGSIVITFSNTSTGSVDFPAINGIEVMPAQVTLLDTGQWLSETLPQSSATTVSATTGVPASGDYDGDGLVDPVTFINGLFSGTYSSSRASFTQSLGASGNLPVPGDYDGDGKTDFAVFDPTTGYWHYKSSKTQTMVDIQAQAQGDIPVPGDYDGDGKTDIAYFDPMSFTFHYIPSSGGAAATVTVGAQAADIPAVGDYDGDGKTDFAVYRPATGNWYYQLSSDPSLVRVQGTEGGISGDVPMPGDYDGDGKTDFAFWRPSTQTLYTILSSALGTNYRTIFLGASTSATPFSLAPFAKAPAVNLAMRQPPPSQLYVLSGTVFHPDGTPFPGATVNATNNYTALQMATDADGGYSFTVQQGNNNLIVSASAAGYTFSPASLGNVTGNLIQNFTASPAPFTATLSGTVSISNTQVANVILTLSGMGSSVTMSPQPSNGSNGSYGTYSFPVSANGSYTVTPSLSGYIFSPTSGSFTVSNGIASSNVNFTATATSTGTLNPSAPLKEYIYLNGQVIAIEHAH